jgi:hypothetical protein
MALTAATSKPDALLAAIKKAIDDKKVETWAYDKDGDLTHTPDQWKNKAWFRPSVEQGRLRFGLLGPKNSVMSKLVYGVYHGRFIEMLLTHFDTSFTSATATAQADTGDSFTTS